GWCLRVLEEFADDGCPRAGLVGVGGQLLQQGGVDLDFDGARAGAWHAGGAGTQWSGFGEHAGLVAQDVAPWSAGVGHHGGQGEFGVDGSDEAGYVSGVAVAAEDGGQPDPDLDPTPPWGSRRCGWGWRRCGWPGRCGIRPRLRLRLRVGLTLRLRLGLPF